MLSSLFSTPYFCCAKANTSLMAAREGE
jgi:hypothetical protein